MHLWELLKSTLRPTFFFRQNSGKIRLVKDKVDRVGDMYGSVSVPSRQKKYATITCQTYISKLIKRMFPRPLLFGPHVSEEN